MAAAWQVNSNGHKCAGNRSMQWTEQKTSANKVDQVICGDRL